MEPLPRLHAEDVVGKELPALVADKSKGVQDKVQLNIFFRKIKNYAKKSFFNCLVVCGEPRYVHLDEAGDDDAEGAVLATRQESCKLPIKQNIFTTDFVINFRCFMKDHC